MVGSTRECAFSGKGLELKREVVKVDGLHSSRAKVRLFYR